jgi:hypothetical protein
VKHVTPPKTPESSHTRPPSSADVRPSPFAAYHRATMAAIRPELAAEFGADFFATFTPAELVDAERAFDEARDRASAEAFAIGIEAAALKAPGPALRDDLPALWARGSVLMAVTLRLVPRTLYRGPLRHIEGLFDVVERCVNRLEQWRSVATRFEQRAVNDRATVTIAALVMWPADSPGTP